MPLYLSLRDRSLIRHFHPSTQDTLIATCDGLWVNFRDFISLPSLRADSSSGTRRQRMGSPDAAASWEQRLLFLKGLFLAPGVSHVFPASTWFPKRLTVQPSRGKQEKEPSVQHHWRLYLASLTLCSVIWATNYWLHWGWGRRAHAPVFLILL